MDYTETSTEELVEIARKQTHAFMLDADVLLELSSRYSYFECPKDDRAMIMRLDHEVFIPHFGHTRLPPLPVLPPYRKPLPPPYYLRMLRAGQKTNVFLSRPTVVEPAMVSGLEVFLNVLDCLDLRPRTLGISDTPLRSPLREVATIMEACKGLVVLAMPQTVAAGAVFRGARVEEDLVLASEWNQIETCIGHSMRKPILLIADPRIDRGIFSEGAIDIFVHRAEFTDPAWARSDQIGKALAEFKRRTAT